MDVMVFFDEGREKKKMMTKNQIQRIWIYYVRVIKISNVFKILSLSLSLILEQFGWPTNLEQQTIWLTSINQTWLRKNGEAHAFPRNHAQQQDNTIAKCE